jgi:hypothetical protein
MFFLGCAAPIFMFFNWWFYKVGQDTRNANFYQRHAHELFKRRLHDWVFCVVGVDVVAPLPTLPEGEG